MLNNKDKIERDLTEDSLMQENNGDINIKEKYKGGTNMSNQILNKERKNIMENLTVNTKKTTYADTNINDAGCYEDTHSTNETPDLHDKHSIFSLHLQENTAGLFCSCGGVSTEIIEPEKVYFTPDCGALFFNISYKKGLHILKSLGYEKSYANFSSFDDCVDDDSTSTQTIYYQEVWKRIQ